MIETLFLKRGGVLCLKHIKKELRRKIMLKASKNFLIIAGVLLILDAILMAAGKSNPLFG